MGPMLMSFIYVLFSCPNYTFIRPWSCVNRTYVLWSCPWFMFMSLVFVLQCRTSSLCFLFLYLVCVFSYTSLVMFTVYVRGLCIGPLSYFLVSLFNSTLLFSCPAFTEWESFWPKQMKTADIYNSVIATTFSSHRTIWPGH